MELHRIGSLISDFYSQVYSPWEWALLDTARPAIKNLAGYLESLPSSPLSSGLPSDKNEATWYLTPEENAERMVLAWIGVLLSVLVMYFTGALSTIRKSMGPKKSQRHPLLAILCFGIYVSLVVMKYWRNGIDEVKWMVMPCHCFILFMGIWAIRPSPLLLNLLFPFHANFVIATLLPDFEEAYLQERVLFYVQHALLDLFPFYVVYMDYIRPTDSVFWGFFVALLFYVFYGCLGVPVGLTWNKNLCYNLSPPKALAKFHSKNYTRLSVIVHFTLFVGSHTVHQLLSKLYALCRKSKQQ